MFTRTRLQVSDLYTNLTLDNLTITFIVIVQRNSLTDKRVISYLLFMSMFCVCFISRQEGWRLENTDATDPDSPLVFKGVVFNEMKGVFVSQPFVRCSFECTKINIYIFILKVQKDVHVLVFTRSYIIN